MGSRGRWWRRALGLFARRTRREKEEGTSRSSDGVQSDDIYVDESGDRAIRSLGGRDSPAVGETAPRRADGSVSGENHGDVSSKCNEVDGESPRTKTREQHDAPGSGSCRVCFGHHGPLLQDHLLSPCDCRGSSKYIHRKCLYNWMDAKPGTGPSRNNCEICGALIDTKTLLGPLRGDRVDEDAAGEIVFLPFFGKRMISLRF
jgi:hypothetical protein